MLSPDQVLSTPVVDWNNAGLNHQLIMYLQLGNLTIFQIIQISV